MAQGIDFAARARARRRANGAGGGRLVPSRQSWSALMYGADADIGVTLSARRATVSLDDSSREIEKQDLGGC